MRLDAFSMANCLHTFSETKNIAFYTDKDDETSFNFPTFDNEDPEDISATLVNGEPIILGRLARSPSVVPRLDANRWDTVS